MATPEEIARAAARPSESDIAVAEDTILATLSSDHPTSRDDLLAAVDRRFRELPFPAGFLELKYVDLDECRRVWSTAATIMALAVIQWSGRAFPLGGVGSWQPSSLVVHTVSPHGAGALAVLAGEYAFGIGDRYQLAPGATPADLESPLTFLHRLPARIGPRVRRVLAEAVESYRARRYLATATMLGVASEAAWIQLAHAILAHGHNQKLKKLLEGTEAASADRIVAQVLDLLEARGITGDYELRLLREREAFYRDLRNHAVHAPEATFEEARFTRPATGLQVEAAPDYFRRLYAIIEKIS